MAKINIRRDKNWRRRCKWTLVTLGAVALWVYNGTDMWVERAPACPAERARAPAPPSCAPCPAAPSSLPAGDPLATLDPRLGRWDAARAFKLFDAAAVGADYTKLSSARKVCLATQSSIERLHELLRIATHWSGPLSVAVYVAADELRFLRGFAIWLLRCQPSVYKRLALHVAMPAERPAYHGPVPGWATDCSAKPLPKDERSNETKKWRVRAPYPQNHMRNMARRNCHTPYVFLVDIDIIPSMYMAESLEKFLSSEIKCYRCAYVVPTYELDRRVATFPANKSELLRLSRNKLAVPFHKKVFIYNQYASNFSRWEATGGNESLEAHVSHDVTNFELLYEPFYVAPDTVPAHDERFVGYGFTRNTQVYEMFLMGYKFKVLSPIFTIHWGLQSRRHRPLWRERQNQANRKLFETFKRELYVRAKLTSGRRRKAALRSAKLARDRSLTAPMRSVKLSSGRRLKVPMRPHNRYRKDPLHLIFKKGQQPKKI